MFNVKSITRLCCLIINGERKNEKVEASYHIVHVLIPRFIGEEAHTVIYPKAYYFMKTDVKIIITM